MAGLYSILGGLIGAAVGVVAWVLVGYFGHYEVGWIAWAMGFATGFGVRYGGYLRDEDASFAKGVLAAALAIGAIVTAKFVVFSLLVEKPDPELMRTLASSIRFDPEGIVAGYADEIAADSLARGETVAWPPGVSRETASVQKDYPPKIWKQAEQRWRQLGPQKQEKEKTDRMVLSMKLSMLTKQPNFGDSFAPWDLLWFGLAVVTAFKIGVGSYGSE